MSMVDLEEYLDTLEALPAELQRQFTLMRELDALSQDIQEQMKQATEEFVENPPTKDDPRHVEYMKNFVQLFSTVLKHSEEKVALATQTYDSVDKHIRKLDDDLRKFEEKQFISPSRIQHSWVPSVSSSMGDASVEERVRRDDGGSRKKRGHKEASPPPGSNGKMGTPSGRRGHGGGRGGGSADMSMGVAATASAAIVASVAGGSGSKNGSGQDGGSKSRNSAKAAASMPDFAEMPIDPNEPRYCYCRQVSYGEMVACDDENCEVEWFHLGCVDLRAPPKGQWFCRDCSQKHKKRRDHHS